MEPHICTRSETLRRRQCLADLRAQDRRQWLADLSAQDRRERESKGIELSDSGSSDSDESVKDQPNDGKSHGSDQSSSNASDDLSSAADLIDELFDSGNAMVESSFSEPNKRSLRHRQGVRANDERPSWLE